MNEKTEAIFYMVCAVAILGIMVLGAYATVKCWDIPKGDKTGLCSLVD